MIFRGIRVFSTPLRRIAYTAPRTSLRVAPTFQRWNIPRSYATTTSADDAIEEIQELYATARDEFEIAAEETVKKTVYAADDRAAAQEELKKLKDAYGSYLENSSPEVSSEIQRRVGQRIRELDNAMTALEESAMED